MNALASLEVPQAVSYADVQLDRLVDLHFEGIEFLVEQIH